jgi:hypothetical protein
VTLFEVFSFAQRPYDGHNDDDIRHFVTNEPIKVVSFLVGSSSRSIPQQQMLTPSCLGLINNCLTKDVSKRANIEQLVQSLLTHSINETLRK